MTDHDDPGPIAMRHAAFCKKLIRHRRAMVDVLGIALCPAPVWDMLLALYIARCEGRKIHLLALCAASGVPTATAHRKIADLVDQGMVERYDSPIDRRQVELRLTEKGREAIDSILQASII